MAEQKRYLLLGILIPLSWLCQPLFNVAMAESKGSISGVIRLAEIAGYDNGKVVYKHTDCFGCLVFAGKYMTISGYGGRFRLTGIPEGSYSLQASFEACISGKHDEFKSPPFTISRASPRHQFLFPIDLLETTTTIQGIAHLEGRKDHSGIVVTIKDLQGYQTVTNSNGAYTIPSVPVRIRTWNIGYTKSMFSEFVLRDVAIARENSVIPIPDVRLTPVQEKQKVKNLGG